MSATETPRAPEGADHHEDTHHEDTGRSETAREAEHVAAEAARRQARQDPLQG